MACRVLIIDDHPVVLLGLRYLIDSEACFIVCGEADSVSAAQERAHLLQPDLVILDLVLGGDDGLGLLVEIARIAPAARILVYSSHDENRYARRCIEVGASGFVPKSEGPVVLTQALHALQRNEIFLTEAIRMTTFRASATETGARVDGLSNREVEVLRRLASDYTIREIADALALSTKTVSTYCERLKFKLELQNLRELESFARDQFAGSN